MLMLEIEKFLHSSHSLTSREYNKFVLNINAEYRHLYFCMFYVAQLFK